MGCLVIGMRNFDDLVNLEMMMVLGDASRENSFNEEKGFFMY